MSSWLSNRLGLHLNLRPLAAPAGALVGGMFGGSLGAGLGAGIAKTADNKLHGDSWTHSLGQGALNGLAYGGGTAALDALKGAFSPGSGAGAATASTGPLGPGEYVNPMEMGQAAATGASSGGPSILSRIGSGAGRVGSFLESHPNTASAGLNAIGSIGQMDSANALRHAQTGQIEEETARSKAELEAQRNRTQAMMALFQAFGGGGKIGQMPQAPAYQTPTFTPAPRYG